MSKVYWVSQDGEWFLSRYENMTENEAIELFKHENDLEDDDCVYIGEENLYEPKLDAIRILEDLTENILGDYVHQDVIDRYYDDLFFDKKAVENLDSRINSVFKQWLNDFEIAEKLVILNNIKKKFQIKYGCC